MVAEQSKANYLVKQSALEVLACTITMKAAYFAPFKEARCNILAAGFTMWFKEAQVLFKARGLLLKV